MTMSFRDYFHLKLVQKNFQTERRSNNELNSSSLLSDNFLHLVHECPTKSWSRDGCGGDVVTARLR